MSDTFTVQVRDPSGNTLRVNINKNWTLNTLLTNLEVAAGGTKIETVGIYDRILSKEKHGLTRLHEFNIVPNLQLTVYQPLNGGKV